MTMKDVSPSEWCSFFERFSREHRAWLATLHWVSNSANVMATHRVALESVGLEGLPTGIVRLCVLDGPAVRLERPEAVRVEQDNRHTERALEIETEGGLFRLAFRATALPEELDGMAPGEIYGVKPSRCLAEKRLPAA